MGKVIKKYYEELIPETPDRNPNRIFIFLDQWNYVGIHFRNIKWQLTLEQFGEWQKVFKEALEEFNKQDKLKYDI